jgi:ubiquinone biosynthesis protein
MKLSRLGRLSRTYRHADRYRQILSVMLRYGFGDVIDRLHVGPYIEMGLRIGLRESLEKLSRAERVRMALEELGPTFVKMGQILSTRPDLIPLDLIEELSKLQDNVPPFAFEQVKEIVEEELGCSLHERFGSFDDIPLAAASIGQVHRAHLRSGEEVVVKVQRPGIRPVIETDIEILGHLAGLMEKYIEEMTIYRPARIVEEFAGTLEREMDYTIEASNQERFARQFAGHDHVHVPKICREALTGRVLTMEYIDGIKASELEKLDQAGMDRKVIASRGAGLILEQIFKQGFFHADPHPGNVFVMKDNTICYLDFGIMGYVDRHAREHFVDMIYSYVSRDETGIATALLRLTEWEQEPNRQALERDIRGIMDLHLYKPLKELRVKDLLRKTLELIARHRLVFPPDIFLMIKGLTVAEGLGLMLDPGFDMAGTAEPFVAEIKAERLKAGRVISDIREYGSELIELIKELPAELHDIVRQIRQGKMKIGFEHRGLEKFIFEIDRSSNRIAFALVISSIVIGSSLIITTNIGPRLLGFPVLGLAGYLMAGVLGIWLLVSILRSGRL